MNLSELLEAEGYKRVPLSRGDVGHFHAEGTLNGHPVDVLLDTGAASTVVNLSVARALGLELTPLPYQGGGAGGAQLDVFKADDAVLEIYGCEIRPKALVAMDLSHVIAALARRGFSVVVEVVVGADVFASQSAVIDYGSSTLFLRAPK